MCFCVGVCNGTFADGWRVRPGSVCKWADKRRWHLHACLPILVCIHRPWLRCRLRAGVWPSRPGTWHAGESNDVQCTWRPVCHAAVRPAAWQSSHVSVGNAGERWDDDAVTHVSGSDAAGRRRLSNVSTGWIVGSFRSRYGCPRLAVASAKEHYVCKCLFFSNQLNIWYRLVGILVCPT